MTLLHKSIIALYLVGGWPLATLCQEFKYTARLDKVTADGFYNIIISPALSANLKTDMADIRIIDEKNRPVPHIIQPGNEVSNPNTLITQKDENGYSYIEVRQDKNYQFDKISLDISGSKYYSRELQIFLPAFPRESAAKPGIVLGNFHLLSSVPPTFELPRTKAAIFFIVIKNDDNPPLKIDKVKTYQHAVSLITYLQHDKTYSLLAGDSLAVLPNYDLQIFKDSITNLLTLNYGKINLIKEVTPKNISGNSNWWIWPAIIIAAIFLSFLTYRLTTEINHQKEK